jgi:hypothetical protein
MVKVYAEIMPSTRHIDPDQLTFVEIQTRIFKFFAKADQNIKDKLEIVKKVHTDLYTSTISNYNGRCFPSLTKKKMLLTLSNYFAKKVAPAPAPAPSCTEKAFEDLKEGLPANFNFNDIIQWIARKHMISVMENFDNSNSGLDNSQSGEDDTDIDSSLKDRHDVTSKIQLHSSNLDISGISVSRNDMHLNSSCDDSRDILSVIKVVETHFIDIDSDDDCLIKICEKEDEINCVREDVSFQGIYFLSCLSVFNY